MEKASVKINLVIIGLLALVCSMGFTTYKSNAARVNLDEWIRAKKTGALSCGTGASRNLNSYRFPRNEPGDGHESKKNNQPSDNGKGCSHLASAMCNATGSKRKLFKLASC